MNRVLGGFVGAVMAISVGTAALAQKSSPSATLSFTGGSLAAGVGYSWGGGTLSFQGKQYRFTVNGLSVVDVGVSTIDGTGAVYNLRNVNDFAGTYYAAGAGATLVGGGSMTVLENQHGMVIHFFSRTAGLKLTAAGAVVTIGLSQE